MTTPYLDSIPRFGIPYLNDGYSVTPDGHAITWKKPGFRGKPVQLVELVDDDGYLYVRMMRGPGARRNYRLHRITCETYHGPKPSPAHQVCHKDGNKLNNHHTNLQWGTAKTNAEHRDEHGTTSRGPSASAAQYTRQERELAHDLALLAASYSAFDKAGRELGVDATELAKTIDLAALIRAARELHLIGEGSEADTMGDDETIETMNRMKHELAKLPT